MASKRKNKEKGGVGGNVGLQADDSQLQALRDLTQKEDDEDEEETGEDQPRGSPIRTLLFLIILMVATPNIARILSGDETTTLAALQCQKAGDRNGIYLVLDKDGNCVPGGPLPYSIQGDASHSWQLFASDELRRFGGADFGDPLYGCLLGRCYDLSPLASLPSSSPLSALTATDGTLALLSPQSSQPGDAPPKSPDLSDLTTVQLLALSRWQSYLDTHSTYEVVGVVIGPYYNANGRETATLREAKARMAAARESEEAAKAQRLVASLGGATDRKSVV